MRYFYVYILLLALSKKITSAKVILIFAKINITLDDYKVVLTFAKANIAFEDYIL